MTSRTPRPQPYYARFTQPPRSPSNGRNRQPAASNHSDPLDRADPSAGRPAPRIRTGVAGTIWYTSNHTLLPFPPAGPGLTLADYTKLMDQIIGRGMPSLMPYTDPSPTTTIPYAGLTSGEITGHRGWVVLATPNGLALRSLTHHFIWEPSATITGDINEVVIDNPFQPIYGGVYAFRDRNGLDLEIAEASGVRWPQWRTGNNTQHKWLGFAYGTVKLWGETVEHERGYRASFAKLTSIDGFVGIDNDFILDTLRDRYHV